MSPAGRPSFTRGFPPDAALDALVAAFAAGDYARVRAEAPALAASTDDDDVRRAARALCEGVEADPLAKLLLAFTAALLLVLSAWWIANDHPPASVEPTAPRVIERIPDRSFR